MDMSEIYVSTIYSSIIVSGWIDPWKILQGLGNIYCKKLHCVYHHKNFEESILQDIKPYDARI